MQVLLRLFNEMPASSYHVETILPDVHTKTDRRLQLVQIKVVEIISKIPKTIPKQNKIKNQNLNTNFLCNIICYCHQICVVLPL